MRTFLAATLLLTLAVAPAFAQATQNRSRQADPRVDRSDRGAARAGALDASPADRDPYGGGNLPLQYPGILLNKSGVAHY